jgi:2-polyprenyl-3-methyl-5-hydroxy-6-metoxy-1,4-benzoquinol methylase
MATMFYRVDFRVRDEDPLQQTLNKLYGYQTECSTKVLHRSRLNLFFLFLQDLTRRGVVERFGSALDIGCNAGAYVKIISELGFQSVTGVDLSADFIDRATAEFGSDPAIAFHVQNAEELRGEQLFDLILCTEVIEHTLHPELVVANIKRLLAPGGVAIVSLPNRFSVPYALQLLSHKVRRKPIDRELRAHLRFPFYRTIELFDDPPRTRVVATTATNLFLESASIRLLYRTPIFPIANWLNFQASRLWPFKFVSQFFFVVVKREEPEPA